MQPSAARASKRKEGVVEGTYRSPCNFVGTGEGGVLCQSQLGEFVRLLLCNISTGVDIETAFDITYFKIDPAERPTDTGIAA